MKVSTIPVAVIPVLLIVSALNCSDMGHDPNTAGGPLMASTLSVVLVAGGQASVTISGGLPPYEIQQQPDPLLASAQFVNPGINPATLLITVPTTVSIGGTTQVRIRDAHHDDAMIESPQHDVELRIDITVSASQSVSFSSNIQPIFNNNCSGCHPGGGAPFSLESGASYGNLVNVTATTGPCAGMPRVKPFHADSSALFKRIAGTCGTQMPIGGSALSAAEQNLIATWINQGANNN